MEDAESPGRTGPAPIVVGLARRDDDAAPLALAAAMARLTGGPLAVVCAMQHEPIPGVAAPHVDVPLLEEVLPSLEDHGVDLRADQEVSVHACPGSPARVLHRLCSELEAAMVVVGSSRRGRVGRVLAGGVAERLLTGASCAVAVAPRDYRGTDGFGRIAVAYDGSTESREALGAAMALAFCGGGAIHSFTVVEPFTWSSGIASAGASAPVDFEPLRRDRAEGVAAEVLGLAPEGIAVRSEVARGRVAEQLTSRSGAFDLLVCGSRGYGPVRSVVLGSVSHSLVSHAACPVLVMPREPVARHRLRRHPAAARTT
jgi:nucleotide-binding universal stress UspA family protein